MLKFNILCANNALQYADKVSADCRALALAIGYYFPDAMITQDYVRNPNGNQLIIGENIAKYKLLWFKYILQKPLLLPKTKKFSLINMGVTEHNDMLNLCNTRLFTSCSYGLGYDANALARHVSRHPMPLSRLNMAYAETEGALITSAKPLSNQLVEALAFDTKIVFAKSAQNKPWLTAKIPEDVPHILAKQDLQDKLKSEILTEIREVKITQNELRKLSN